MAFPWHDAAWVEAGDFVASAMRPGEAVLAPDLFWWRLGPIHRLVRANLTVPPPSEWVVVHKGETASLPRPFADGLLTTRHPVFANDVFVVFAARDDLPTVDRSLPTISGFLAELRTLPIDPTRPLPAEADRVLGDHPVLASYASLPRADLRQAYESFFEAGGYRYPTVRDQAYYDEIHGWLARATESWRGRRILEVCCAAVPFIDRHPTGTVVRTDLAVTAVAHARDADRGAHADWDRIVHAVVDAEDLAFVGGSFHGVAFVDAIEHVTDASKVILEVGRVLEPGGELLLTFANRNSLNYVLNRALGFPEFGTNHQHIAEFTLDEVTAMATAAGLDVVETGGVEFRPYIGVPGVDDATRAVVDEDPEVVELLREVGRRAGAEYAYVGVVLARKP
jgi:ubiquinone/menaquinone biosynthesis C-methylase UbiE